jgi:cation transport ATPase
MDPLMTPETEPQSSLWPRILLSAVLLAAYAMAMAWAFHMQSMEWPHEGSMAYVVFFLLCPGIVFQSFNLAYMLRAGRRLTRRALTRLVTIPLGLVMAAFLSIWASTLAMSGFEQAYVPFVTQVGANLRDPCPAAGSYFQAPAVTAYNLQTGRHRERPARLHHDAKRFVLAFQGGSADIDGSTIYYDSGAGAWRKFHNDSSDDREAYAALTAGLAECVLKAQ